MLYKDSFLFPVPYVHELHNVATYWDAVQTVFLELVYNGIQFFKLWCHTTEVNHYFC